jgi:hypothetical protein
MAFWDKFVGNLAENTWKGLTKKEDIIPNLLTGGLYGVTKVQLKTGGETLQDYQQRNGGNAAEKAMRQSQEAMNLSATQQAQAEFEKGSKAAGMAYASGGSNMQSFTNRSQNKKSILGSF